MSLLELKNVVKRFPVRRGLFGSAKEFVHAVNDVSLSVENGELVGLVGESGCGKSTLGRIAVGLYKPDSGEVLFNGDKKEKQIIFQDPFSSLNPRMSVGDIVAEPLIIHNLCKRKDRFKRAEELLNDVGLDPSYVCRYPHEFSGGQRQRICIARAVSLRPKFIVADEPVSSLDVAVQAEILELLKKLQRQHNMAYLFISHDLRVVSSICGRIVVMYLGKIVEILPAEKLKTAVHPYTIALLSAVPIANPHIKKKRIILTGDVPSPVNIPSGCPFHPRCRYKKDICVKTTPVLESKTAGHFAACHFDLSKKAREI